MNTFHKRFYTLPRFFKDLKELVLHVPGFIATIQSKRVNRPLAEKIMLAVAGVNDCSYCSYLHTKSALKGGVSKEETQKLLSQEIGEFQEDEFVALAFTQHYVENKGEPDPEIERHFYDHYGSKVGQDIVNLIRVVDFFTLVGNTAYAFLSRLRGKPAEKGNPLSEIVILLLCAPWAFLTLLYDIGHSNEKG